MEFKKFFQGQVEYRFDPLSGRETRINPERAKRLKPAESGDGQLKEVIEKSRANCPFCPERIEEKTPVFPFEIGERGKIKRKETIIFPNLNPFGQNHAVGVLSDKHFLEINEFKEELIADNLLAAQEYFLSLQKADPEATWPIWVLNYLPPSAGSIIHPHTQILLEKRPVPELQILLGECIKYWAGSGQKNYWQDLIKREKEERVRFIGEIGLVTVMASFAPRGFNEVLFIVRERSSLNQLTEKDIVDFASALAKVLAGFKEMGVGSFNVVSFSDRIDSKREHYYWLNFRLISRPYPRGLYTSDTGPMERLYGVAVIDTLPEITAERVREHF